MTIARSRPRRLLLAGFRAMCPWPMKRQREPPHPGSHLCYSSPVPIRWPCAGLGAATVGQHSVPAPPAPSGTRSTEAAEGGSGGAGYAVAVTALIAATSATTRVRSISFFTLSPFHVLLVLSAPGTYLGIRPREGRLLGTHGDVHLLPISQTARGPSIFHLSRRRPTRSCRCARIKKADPHRSVVRGQAEWPGSAPTRACARAVLLAVLARFASSTAADVSEIEGHRATPMVTRRDHHAAARPRGRLPLPRARRRAAPPGRVRVHRRAAGRPPLTSGLH
jgi:hypothetical protein